MSTNWFSQLGGLLQQYAGGQQPPPAQVEQHFDQVAQSAPPSSLSEALASAFRSNETPPFADLVSKLFSHSNPDQNERSALGSHGLSVIGGRFVACRADLVPGRRPPLAWRCPPDVERASAFYAQHPFVVKMLGAAAPSAVMTRAASTTVHAAPAAF